ncbi:MAG: TonB-dependent receptor, partial [Gemmatimonadota bacterium]|nr:TonB-dependent receptor [Gemmatimonadota bacterium]
DSALAARGLASDHPLRAPIPTLRGGFSQLAAAAGPLLATLPNGERALVVSYTNAGRVENRGIELGIAYQATGTFRLDGSYAFFDFKVKEQQIGDALLPNTPKQKGNIGLTYTGAQGLDATAGVRIAEGFPWAAGVFSGYVPASQIVSASVGYRFSRGLRVHAIATNLLDQQRFQLYGGSVIGRRVLVGGTATY